MTDTTHPKTLARRTVLRALVASEREEWSPGDFSGVDGSVRPFAREIYSSTLRHRARLDWTLAPLLKKPVEKLDAPVRAALRLALYEKVALRTPDRALVNEYAGLMRGEKLGSATGFVNAIARRLPAQWRPAPTGEIERLSIELSHPRWLVERYVARFGAVETEELLRANNQVAPSCLRVNTLRASREALLSEIPGAVAGKWSPDAIYVERGDVTALPQWDEGQLFAQDEAAQLVARLAAPEAGAFVIDAASAPGGKTTHLAQLMGDKGRILALDSAPPRLQLVRDNAKRLGIGCIETRAGDFRVITEQMTNNGVTQDGVKADLLLLDAPCLGTGTFRRRPDAKWRKTPEQLLQLLDLQRQLLDSAASLIKVGGALVYSTCSLEAEENEGQVEAFLTRHCGFSVEKAPVALEGVTGESGYLNTFPHRHGCDGMFAAKLRRTD